MDDKREQREREVNDVLQSLNQQASYQQGRTYTTDDIPPIDATQEYNEKLQQYDIEIHIYPKEDEAEPEERAPIIDSSATVKGESDSLPTDPPQYTSAQRRKRPLLIGVLCCLCIVLLGIGVSLPHWMPQDTTITIVPITRTLTTSIQTSFGADPQSQVPGRRLPSITMSQAQTTTTTGNAHQDAQAAHGPITFYNSALYAQTIPAGTLLTAANGIQVVTDQEAIVNAVAYPTLGQTTITAHAIQAGLAGNLKAGAIYGPCCFANISAVNGVFQGGQEARDYQTVTQRDIDTTARNLKTSLDQSTQVALQTQVQSGETLVTPLHCQQKISADHQPGEEAKTVHVTLDETCTGMVYMTQALQALMTQAIATEAKKQLGPEYTQIGEARITTTLQGEATIQATGISQWAYQFSQAQQEHMKASIAGKGVIQAKTLLLSLPGVQSVSFAQENTLPDSQHIRFVFIAF